MTTGHQGWVVLAVGPDMAGVGLMPRLGGALRLAGRDNIAESLRRHGWDMARRPRATPGLTWSFPADRENDGALEQQDRQEAA
ncbi:hypothetical protein [Streptomyces sp. SBT349]|uniref:hypothetical protein n=1 Tax=Streptomyces sp. SBT349 TaxID=1580539 RepID=UPI00066E342C|nr:hypothetical protein [Streptomyces sp. SBT349]